MRFLGAGCRLGWLPACREVSPGGVRGTGGLGHPWRVGVAEVWYARPGLGDRRMQVDAAARAAAGGYHGGSPGVNRRPFEQIVTRSLLTPKILFHRPASLFHE